MLINTHSSAPHHVKVLGLVYHNHASDLRGSLGLLKKIGLKVGSFCEIFLRNVANFVSCCSLLYIWYEIIDLDERLEHHST